MMLFTLRIHRHVSIVYKTEMSVDHTAWKITRIRSKCGRVKWRPLSSSQVRGRLTPDEKLRNSTNDGGVYTHRPFISTYSYRARYISFLPLPDFEIRSRTIPPAEKAAWAATHNRGSSHVRWLVESRRRNYPLSSCLLAPILAHPLARSTASTKRCRLRTIRFVSGGTSRRCYPVISCVLWPA